MKMIKKILCFALALIPAGAFADTHLRNCVYDYKPNVFDFSSDGIEEVFIDGRAVVPTVMDLRVGDLFIDEDGVIQVVDSIIVDSEGNLTINSSMPSNVYDFMDMVSIPQQDIEVETGDWDIMGYDAQPELLKQEAENSGMSRGAGTASSGGMLGNAIPVSERDMTPNINVTIPLGSSASADEIAKSAGATAKQTDEAKKRVKDKSGGSLTIKAEVPYLAKKFSITPKVDLPYTTVITRKKTYNIYKKEYWTKENWYHPGSASLNVDLDLYTGIGFEIDVVAKKACEITICQTPTTGITAGLYLWPELTLMSSMTLQKYVHVQYACGCSCDLDGEYILCVPHNFNKYVYRNDVHTGSSFDGSIVGTAGIFIGPKVAVSIAGFDLAAISAKFGPEAKAVFPLIGCISYNDPNNEIGNGDYLGTSSAGGVVNKIYGSEESKFTLYLKATVGGSFIKGLISTDFYTWKSSPIIELPKDWGKFGNLTEEEVDL